MQSDQPDTDQWQAEIRAFVSDTNSQLLEIRDQLAMHFAGSSEDANGDSAERQAGLPAFGPAAVNEQLSTLERLIASRLEQSGNGAG